MLKFFVESIELSSIIMSFGLVTYIMIRIPKEIIGLKENPESLSNITTLTFSSTCLILLLIFLNQIESGYFNF